MTTILTKKKDTTGAPAPGDLTNSAGGAELAVNTFDKRLYTKDSGGNIVEIGTNPSTIDTTTVDTTNLEVTNIKAKDGTASATIADSTGVMTIASSVLTTTDINGGTVDNTAIGATTASTGAFTTLAYSSTLTGGTGVVNLGSGQFYKDASGNVGIGTSSPFTKLDVVGGKLQVSSGGTLGSAGRDAVNIYTGTGARISFYDNSNSCSIGSVQNGGASDLTFATEGTTERMRIDSSGNVGIGTTNMLSKLNVANSYLSAGSNANTSQTNILLQGYGFSNSATIYGNTSIRSTYDNTSNAASLEFYTASSGTSTAERMRIDSSGNVGIGISSPTAGYKLDVNGNIRVAGGGPTELGYGLYATARLNASGNNAIFGFVLDGSQGGAYNGRDWRIEQGRNAVGNFNITEIAGGNPIRLSINGSGNVALSESNASANGIGITFPATQSASSDANCLDDYEEGTWTPSIGGNATYTIQDGAYTKIGRLVYCICKLQINVIGTGSATTISGLPFTSTSTTNVSPNNGIVSYFNGLATSVIVLTPSTANSTTIVFTGQTASATNTSYTGVAVFGSNTRVDFTIIYQAQ